MARKLAQVTIVFQDASRYVFMVETPDLPNNAQGQTHAQNWIADPNRRRKYAQNFDVSTIQSVSVVIRGDSASF